jgi:hypothetical protein
MEGNRMAMPQRSGWWRDLALPLAILAVPVILSVILHGGLLNLMFPVAFAVGYLLVPSRVWPIWIGSILLVWGIYGLATLVDLIPGPDDPESGETVWSFMIEAVIFMAALVLLPLWLGRFTRRRVGGRAHDHGDGRSSSTVA